MNVLRKALDDYFAVRRALGFKLYRAEKLLDQFLTFIEDRGEDHLTTETALAWATLPQQGQTWAYARLSVVRRFANHMRGTDPATEVPPTHLLVQKKGAQRRTFIRSQISRPLLPQPERCGPRTEWRYFGR